MKTALFSLLALICTGTYGQFATENLMASYYDNSAHHTSSDPGIFKDMRIVPIVANNYFLEKHQHIGKYLSLKEALESKKINITEVSEQGTVNTLYAENKSRDTIYIMAGEVVKGGKQDRILASDMILAPGERTNISAFCVERGRWNAGESGGNASFKGYANVASNEVRKKALVDKNQTMVWSTVANTTANNGATTASGTYTALDTSTAFVEKREEYFNHFKNMFLNDSSVVGVVVVTGNRIIGSDIFATHHLFSSEYSNLLYGYITEVITNGGTPTVSNGDIQAYLDSFLANENKQKESLQNNGSLFEKNGQKFRLTSF